jgi:flavodoxin
MYNLFISYAPDSQENRKSVEEVQAAFDSSQFKTVVKKAAESAVTDLAGADIVLFCSEKTGSSEMHPDFAEIARASKGANFAGKTAGFFSFGSEKACSKLRKALHDSNISLFDDEPAVGEKDQKSTDLKEWAGRLAAFHRDRRGGGR